VGRPPARGTVARRAPTRAALSSLALLVALSAIAAGGARAAASGVRWSVPFGVSAPQARDLAPARLALSAFGTAIGFAAYREDDPADARAELATAPARGRLGRPRPLAGAAQVLALAYLGPRLWLLLGTSRPGRACCEAVELEGLAPGRRPVRQTILTGIFGATEGRLQTLGRRVLAVIASAQGVWVSESGAGERFRRPRRLSAPGAEPDAVTSAVLPGGRSAVAWTEQRGPYAPGPARVWIARANHFRLPLGRRVALTVPPGREIDELALTAGRRALSLAFVESWFDASGNFHSGLYVADLRGSVRPRLLSPSAQLASAIAVAAAPGGAQVLAFRSCTLAGACFVRAARRSAAGGYGPSRVLGSSDPGQAPAAAESTRGQALVVFVDALGNVLAAAGARGSQAMGSARMLSTTSSAAAPAAAFAPAAGGGVALWTQGLARERVVAARFGEPRR
jgi:hypothetical protein